MKSINIIGFGTMGIQLTAFFSVIGYHVTVWNRSFPDEKIKRFLKEKKLLTRKMDLHDTKHEVIYVDDIDMLPAAITIEALIEDLDIKKRILNDIKYKFQTPWLFTNSSSFTPQEIHDEAYALHFFNPLYTVKLVETTCPPACVDLLDDIQNAGLAVVHTKSNRGYIANYVLFREIAAAMMLVEKYGYDSKSIDIVHRSLGRQLSVFDVVDFVGVDVTKKIIENLHEQESTIEVPKVLDLAIVAGILGKKNHTSIRTLLDNK